MDVSNSTGLDTDYKVTSSGGTRGEHGWQTLAGHSRVEHEIEPDEGPWKIEFQVPGTNNTGVQTITGRFNNPKVQIVLLEQSGSFIVDIRPVS